MQKSIAILCLIIIGCNSARQLQAPQTKDKTAETDLTSWHLKDYTLDGIPGVSLDKAYDEKLIPKTNKSIIVAVVDTQIDLNQEDLKEQLWSNKNEIPDNGIDDDKNGYIDDVHGWNFYGKKDGDFVDWSNFEYIRVVRKWDGYFKTQDTTKLSGDDSYNFKEYKRAKAYRDYYIGFYENWRKSLVFNIDVYQPSKDALKKFFPKEDYTLKDLDSLYAIYKINDKPYWQRRNDNDRDLGALISYMASNFETNKFSVANIEENKATIESLLQKSLNIDYNELGDIKDNPSLQKGYGNNNVSDYKRLHKHATEVSGIIAAKRNNTIGMKGFSDNIKIMPLSLSINGDEHDKDIALAIYYAVDNGAKVINMSFGKEFSTEQHWVTDATKYAEQRNVLIVHVSGNNSSDIDASPHYPNDYSYKDQKEVASNFINVGATTHVADSTFVAGFSSYGKNQVDLFAPGARIYSLIQDNKCGYDSGTSLAAPMVSATAALIWLSYPKLTVQQVKQIILDSGTVYDIEVLLPGGEGKKVPFKELSKSGKVLNVYNALKMAKEVSNGK